MTPGSRSLNAALSHCRAGTPPQSSGRAALQRTGRRPLTAHTARSAKLPAGLMRGLCAARSRGLCPHSANGSSHNVDAFLRATFDMYTEVFHQHVLLAPIDLMLFLVFGLIPLWSLVNSGWAYLTERRRRPFVKAQLKSARLSRRVRVPNPRDRKF